MPVIAADQGTAVQGLWVNGGGDAVISIQIKGEKLALVLLKTLDAALIDTENPNSQLQGRAVAGIQLGQGFVFRDGQWRGGEIYDPGSGNTYKGRIKLVNENQLELRGYVGLAAFGRSEKWLRLSVFEKQMTQMLDLEGVSYD